MDALITRRRLAWRVLLAAPFALSLVLTLVLGPATIDNPHTSFSSLAVASLVAAVLMLGAPAGLLVPVGVVAFLAFPLLAGLGFNFAPDWARPVVVVIFYGSIAASAAASLTGIVVVLRAFLGRHSSGVVIAAAALGLLVLVGVPVVGFAPAGEAGSASTPLATAVNLGPVINTAQREAEPTFAADGRTMVFNCRDYEICVTHRSGTWEAGRWTTPELLGLPISSDYLDIEPWLSPAGDKLYFTSTRPFARGESLPGLALYVNAIGRLGGQLGVTPLGGVGQDEVWVSYLTDGVWSTPRNLNEVRGEPPVNSAHKDHCLAFSADGNQAFWTSTRPGGSGGNDIWTSRRVDGRWSAPENLGPTVNTAASEHHSIPSPDGRSLYVTSDRAGGFGGEDIYLASRAPDGTWGTPMNAGPRINGPANDRCVAWTPDGTVVLFDSDRPGGLRSKDLWWVHLKEVVPTSTDDVAASQAVAHAKSLLDRGGPAVDRDRDARTPNRLGYSAGAGLRTEGVR